MQLNGLRNKNNPVVCMRNYCNLSRGGKDPQPLFIPPIIKEATSSCSDLVQDTPQHHSEHFVYECCLQPASEQADLTTRLEQEGFYIFGCHLAVLLPEDRQMVCRTSCKQDSPGAPPNGTSPCLSCSSSASSGYL